VSKPEGGHVQENVEHDSYQNVTEHKTSESTDMLYYMRNTETGSG